MMNPLVRFVEDVANGRIDGLDARAEATRLLLESALRASPASQPSLSLREADTDRIGYCPKCKRAEWWDQYTICTNCHRSLLYGSVEDVERVIGKRRPSTNWPQGRLSVRARAKAEGK